MDKIKYVLKIFLGLMLVVLLILLQLFIIGFILTTLQNLIVTDKNYLLMTSGVLYKYAVVFIIVITFFVITFFHKKGWIKLNEDLLYLSKFLYNKVFIRIFTVLSLVVFIIITFNFNAIYDNKIVSYSILNPTGIAYEYKDIEEVEVKIKKYWNGSLEANYILTFNNHKVDVLGAIINTKNEEDSYDHNIFIDTKIKTLGINKQIDDKYLDKYVETLDKKYADKIKILFEKTND